METARILVVDDEQLIRWSLREALQAASHRVVEAGTGAEALARARQGVDLVVLDVRLPDADGLGLLRQLREELPDAPVILMTAQSTIESAVQAMKEGAYHYVRKPFELDDMVLLVGKGLETTQLKRELRALRERHAQPAGFDRLIGDSGPMREVKALLAKIATSPASTVLLLGESGTGKDVCAKAVHYSSERAAGPFLNITCSALPEALLESELFGHERGAFTDARQQRKGLLELSDGGTAFLDEIGEMTPQLQAKLLRFLEEKAFRRVGGQGDIRVDVRVVAATNRDLEQAVRDGAFREDLYYRLRVFPVRLPPLRDRTGDVPLLAKHFVDAFNGEFRKSVKAIAAAAVTLLESHAWPGNVRELRNAVERAVLLAEGDVLQAADFGMLGPVALGDGSGFRLPSAGVDLAQLERQLVVQALERTGGNQTRAAALLGMNRDQIRYRIEKFGLGSAPVPDAGADAEAGAG